ncbi:MAG: hypothetical protein L0220_16870 [Acidobacteria bacterium]|nr:hypothetical protein [Acidobacteriota bacterium]
MRLLLFALICGIAISHSEIVQRTQKDDESSRSSPIIYWTPGVESAEALKRAGIEQICVPPDKVDSWRAAGLIAIPVSPLEIEQREKMLVPGIVRRANVAGATSRPWIDSNGWRFIRNPAGKFFYELPTGKAALAAAEVFAYNRPDAIMKIDQAELEEAGKMLNFLRGLPQENLSPVADIALIDDGSPLTGEVMNLLSRRNLLYRIVKTPSRQSLVNIKFGTKEYPASAAADPSAFAQKVRRRITDERRTLRVFGNEVVICRLTGDGSRVRLHLLNYSGREIDSMRMRLRGNYSKPELKIFGYPNALPEDYLVAGGATEFTVPKMRSYAMVELSRKITKPTK